MQTFKFHRAQTDLFSAQQVRISYDQESILPFIERTFSEGNLLKQTELKGETFSKESREILVEALRDQYMETCISERTDQNISSLLDENTFTITTGHQLSLFTGPLFFVVKILHVIKLCNDLSERNPDKKFVPVYWMATEDHDFEEIQSLNIFNKDVVWNSEQQGPVGRFELDEGFEVAKSEIKNFFRDEHEEVLQLIKSYNGANLAEATRNLVQELFDQYGLVIIDGDDRSLKQSFAPIVEKELRSSFSFDAVSVSTSKMEKEGLAPQINPREINLFYIEDGLRSRIIKDGHKYEIQGKGSFSIDELLEMLRESPESFSPNVVLRPLYQEVILPNIAYIGGSSEITYWLQLKGVFDHREVPYPLINIRNSVLWIDSTTSSKITKCDLKLEDVFKQIDLLKREYVEANEGEVLDFGTIDSAREQLRKAIDVLIAEVDPGLNKYARSECSKLEKQVEGIKSKLIRTSKKKHDDAMKAIDSVKDRLFPDNGLMERKVNFFQFAADGQVRSKIEKLYSALEPFENDLIVIRDVN